MSKFIQAEIIEVDSGTKELWNIPIEQEHDRGPNGTLIKKESRQQTSSQKKGVKEWVEPRFNIKALLDLMDMNVWHTRCIRLKSKLTIGLGYKLVHLEDPEVKPDKMHKEISDWLKKPNKQHHNQTFQRILDKFGVDYYALGNSYLETSLQVDGRISEMYHVRSETMRRGKVLRDGGYWQVLDPSKATPFNTFGAENRDPQKTDIIHYYDYDPRDDYYGIGSWYPALADIVMERTSVEYMINTFRNQLVAKFAILIEGGRLSADAKKMLRDFLKNNATGVNNAGNTIVLDTDDPNVNIKIEKLQVSLGEKGNWFAEGRNDTRDHIIAAHGVLPRLLGVMSAGQLGGGAEAMAQLKSFYEIEILPEQIRIEDLLNNTVFETFGPDNPWRIDFNEMDTSNAKDMAETINTLVGQPVMDVNEGRSKLGLKALDAQQLQERQAKDSAVYLEKLRKSIEALETS